LRRLSRLAVLVATFFVMMDIPITRALGSTPGGSTGITGQLWFNVCTAPFQSTMQTWWNSSPYWDIGLYIGGPDLSSGCKSSNLTAKWISNVNDQGWSFVPTWIGPQSHCATVGTYGTYISNDTTTAYNQGVTAADDAYTAAASLGFSSGSVHLRRYRGLLGYQHMRPSSERLRERLVDGTQCFRRSRRDLREPRKRERLVFAIPSSS